MPTAWNEEAPVFHGGLQRAFWFKPQLAPPDCRQPDELRLGSVRPRAAKMRDILLRKNHAYSIVELADPVFR